ncbi:hypothetical protein GALL_12480 [mine drainage metagenome]|uniref:Uncharacterized protein n=1 Tax=mine drainage metagenome TaxID=410659 RepID=A0A1J5TDB1_9ZZZZ
MDRVRRFSVKTPLNIQDTEISTFAKATADRQRLKSQQGAESALPSEVKEIPYKIPAQLHFSMFTVSLWFKSNCVIWLQHSK